LVERGAEVLGADVDAERAAVVCSELDIESVDSSAEFDVPCDVFAPCALGGILHDLTVKRLRARIVAGGANNVLAREDHGDRLHERGVLYAPDFAINSGALILGALFHLRGTREPGGEIESRIGRAVEAVFAAAAEENAPPARVAVREAERRIAERRRQHVNA
jgi:leucine dehydrogenase